MTPTKPLLGTFLSNLEKLWARITPGTLEWRDGPQLTGWTFDGLLVPRCDSDMNTTALAEAVLHVRPGEPWEAWARGWVGGEGR